MSTVEELKSKIPDHYQMLTFKDIKPGVSKEYFILGQVHKRYTLQKKVNGGHVLKLIIKEINDDNTVGNIKLTVFFFDGLAVKADILEIGDYVAVAGYVVEELTIKSTLESLSPYQIILEPLEDEQDIQTRGKPEVWTSNGLPTEKFVITEESSVAQYKYVTLDKLRPSSTPYNIYGVVMKCEITTTSQSHTPCMKLTLTDPSTTEFKCTILNKKETDTIFPDVDSGDIVRIHRLHVDMFKCNIRGVTFNAKNLLIFRQGETKNPFAVSKNFTYEYSDKLIVEKLKQWKLRRGVQVRRISDMILSEYEDIICQVIAIDIINPNKEAVLQVWDGSKLQYPIENHINKTDSRKCAESLYEKVKDYIVNVRVYDRHASDAANLLPGQWIEILNVHLYKSKITCIVNLSLHSGLNFKRGITLLKENDLRVKKLKEQMSSILNFSSTVSSIDEQIDDIPLEDNAQIKNKFEVHTLKPSQNKESPHKVKSTLTQNKYVTLDKLIPSILATFNVYAVVVNCEITTASQSDSCLKLTLTDPTRHEFICTIINKKEEHASFPDVHPGDVVRIHDLHVDKFRHMIRGSSFSPKNILVFNKTLIGDPHTLSTMEYTSDNKANVEGLYKWQSSKKLSFKRLSDMTEYYENIICQIITVDINSKDEAVLQVWDGSKSQCLIENKLSKSDSAKCNESLYNKVKEYAVNIKVYGHLVTDIAKLSPDVWIKINDVHLSKRKYSKFHTLSVHSNFHFKQMIEVLKEDDERVKKLMEDMNLIIQSSVAIPSLEKVIEEENQICSNIKHSQFKNSFNLTAEQINEYATEPIPSKRSRITELRAISTDLEQSKFSDFSQLGFNSQISGNYAKFIAQPESSKCSRENKQCSQIHDDNSELFQGNVHSIESYTDSEYHTCSDGELSHFMLSDIFEDNEGTSNDLFSTARDHIQLNQNDHALSNGHVLSISKVSDMSVYSQVFSQKKKLNGSTKFYEPKAITDDLRSDTSKALLSVTTNSCAALQSTLLSEVIENSAEYKYRVFATVTWKFSPLQCVQDIVYLFCSKCHFNSKCSQVISKPYKTENGIPYYICPRCSPQSHPYGLRERNLRACFLEYVFQLLLQLQDGSSTIDAFLWKENAVKFFKGLSPVEVLKDSNSKFPEIKNYLLKICPNVCSKAKASVCSLDELCPLLDLCIVSCHADSKFYYEITETTLL